MTLRILIVDDSVGVRSAIRDLLSYDPNAWLICGEVADGEQAVTQAKALKPDVILLDLSIPRVSGLEVARSLRELLPSITIVIMSEHESRLLRHVVDSVGLRYCITKSRLGAELILSLENIALDKQPSRNDSGD